MNDFILNYSHPDDLVALEKLNSIPLFPTAVKAFMKVYNERQLHGMNMAQKIRLSPKQLPEIYQYLPPICDTLGIQEPELYLEMNPAPNAYTYGDTQVFITLTSGLIEYLDEDELQATIAHECGHVAFRHTLYSTMAMMLLQGSSQAFDLSDIISSPIRWALLYWFRCSELSSDRAAAVALKTPQPMIETLIRFSGGPKSITNNVDIDLYIQQADAYDDLLENSWDKALQYMAVLNLDHPYSAVRTREIKKWCSSDEYQQVLQSIEDVKNSPRCSKCRAPIEENTNFCGKCGHKLS